VLIIAFSSGRPIDLFAEGLRDIDVCWALQHACQFKNKYMLQSGVIFATTVETNQHYPAVMGNAPQVEERLAALRSFPFDILVTMERDEAESMWVSRRFPLDVMITIEPVMDFDTKQFADMLLSSGASQFNIGADSGRNGLPEPSADKVRELIAALGGNAKIVLKKNLRRILPEHELYES
jgi:hypothetical protein